ncbi:hypothetical protein [Deinococcus aquatilis]|uniref:hypothetical protein n=1 Tax=Deinococcus aquatilis TaxID=519440 RepID=UPI0003665ED0|nr:hypothetical protein [Deinococcus aquatilis]
MKLPRARLALPLLSCTLLLTACPGDTTPPPPAPPVDEATLIAAIDRTPKPLPDLRPAGLGEAGTLGGATSAAFPLGQAISLEARLTQFSPGPAFRLPDAGRITAAGRAEVRLPAAPDLAGSERLTALEWAREFNAFEPCAVNTLQVDPGQEGVRITRVDAVTRNPAARTRAPGVTDMRAGTSDPRPDFSPQPAFANVWPVKLTDTWDISEETGYLIHADGNVRLRGELRCVFSSVTRLQDATQYNLFVNLDLRRGWNVIRRRLDGSVPHGTLEIVDLALSGGAGDFTFGITTSGVGQD